MNRTWRFGFLWLLAGSIHLFATDEGSFKSKPVAAFGAVRAGFSLLNATQTGIQFTNVLEQNRYTTNQIYLNGAGVAAGDIDGDGRCDLYFCNLTGSNALYRNLGDWEFSDVADTAGVSCKGLASTGAALADLDGDNDLDLIVNSVGNGTHIFLNDGKGHFARDAILNEGRGGMSLALADIDGDGDLDVYVCNYRVTTLRDQPGMNFRVNMVDGKPVVASVNGQPTTLPQFQGRYTLNDSGNIAEHGEADALFRNDGKGHFSPVSFTEGAFLDEDGRPLTSPPYDWSLSAMFRDLNGDGHPDLYVCNDFDSVDRIWINRADGTFGALPKLALRNTSRFSMGVDVADINRDGYDDIFVLDMLSRSAVTRLTRADKNMDTTPIGILNNRSQFSRNTLQLGRGDGTYAEIACFAGLDATEWSWTPIFLDVDLDGFEDILVTTGHGRDDMDIDNGMRIERARRSRKMPVAEELGLRKTSPALPGPKMAFRNEGGARFEDFGEKWNFNQVGISHGMCLADLDNDGDLDVVVNNLNAAPGVYRNECSVPRVAVRLKGNGGNTRGIGAKLRFLASGLPTQTQEMICGGRYLSSDDAMRVFAAGSTGAMQLEVTWPSGRQTLLTNLQPNRFYDISPSNADSAASKRPEQSQPLFEEASAVLKHQHHETAFDDFARQALLPNRLSQLGPAISWSDLNGDGRDDLLIGTGKGGRLAIFHNEGSGRFSADRKISAEPLPRDTAGILGLRDQVIVALSNYEDGAENGSFLRDYNLATGVFSEAGGTEHASSGPLAMGDLDADGQLELFVGGRVLAGRYPDAASSRLFQRKEGRWIATNSAGLFKNVGLVTSALWTDLNNDGFPELVLACEWGPLKIFANRKGKLEEATSVWGMQKFIGWWNGVAAGDLDGDGRMDLVASNWGLNSKYRVLRGRGPRLYYAAWGAVGEIEPLEATFDPVLKDWFPERDLNASGRAIPVLREKFQTHRGFAEAGIARILQAAGKPAAVLEANWLESTVFMNRGDHFEPRPLPAIAQFAPAFGINVADFDGDGNEDIFLSQNFFDVQPQTSRNDAGRGLLLKGKGTGDFDAVDAAVSGIRIYGEQRGSAAADYDGDGRVDLAVSQNGAATTLWHNVGGKAGLRVYLKDSISNPTGVGAVLRIRFAGRLGPAREIHAGSGYWSQDSATQVLATPELPVRVEVRWPGGWETSHAVPAGAREITIDRSETKNGR